MKTTKLISNISYNTPAFLATKLTELERAGVIDFAYWIFHKADVEETKDHCHLVLQPAKRIDTKDLTEEFVEVPVARFSETEDVNIETGEIVPYSVDFKPLGVTKVWRKTSSMDDWLLYAVHDSAYLASKGQIRNFHYDFTQIFATDYDALQFDWISIDRSKYNRLDTLEAAVLANIPFPVLVQQGTVPIAQRMQYEKQYNDLKALLKSGASGRGIDHETLDDKTRLEIT